MHEPNKYRSKPNGPIKTATYVALSCDYKPTWGEQHFDGAHYRIDVKDEPPYGCALQQFHDTHCPVIGGWQKVVDVTAYECVEAHPLETIVDGKREAVGRVEPGMWVVINPGRERYAMPAVEFHHRYIAA